MSTSAITLTLLLALKGMLVPEAVYYDHQTGYSYVSNIVGEGWKADKVGFITRLNPDGTVDEMKWRTATPDAPLSAPKGMCVLKGKLYCADINVVHCFDLKGTAAKTIPIPGSEKLNDVATDGKTVYLSDTARGVIFKLDPGTLATTEINAVASLNGITCYEGKLYGVSWDLHEVYEFDAAGEAPARAFGVASHFTNLDGIEAVPGGFIVSDFNGNKVSLLSSDGETVVKLIDVKTPADIGIDRNGLRLFVPQFYGDQVDVYKIGW